MAGVCIDNNCKVIDIEGKTIFENPALDENAGVENSIDRFNEYGLAVVSKWVPRPIFDKGNLKNGRLPSLSFSKNLVLGKKKENYQSDKIQKFGLINRSGQSILPVEFDHISNFEHGVAVVWRDNLAGLVNTSGELILPVEYQNLTLIDDGFVLLQDIMHAGLADTTGTIHIPCGKYTEISRLPNGLLKVYIGQKCSIITFDEQVVVPPNYHKIGEYQEGLFPVGQLKNIVLGNGSDTKWGWVNDQGQEVIPLEYEEAGNFFNGVAPFKTRKNGWGLLGKDGKPILEASLSEIANFRSGLARAKKDGKWGWLDTTGKFVIAPQFDDAKDFTGELAPAKLEKKWGLVDLNGQWVLRPAFVQIIPTKGKHFWVQTTSGEKFKVTGQGKIEFNCTH